MCFFSEFNLCSKIGSLINYLFVAQQLFPLYFEHQWSNETFLSNINIQCQLCPSKFLIIPRFLSSGGRSTFSGIWTQYPQLIWKPNIFLDGALRFHYFPIAGRNDSSIQTLKNLYRFWRHSLNKILLVTQNFELLSNCCYPLKCTPYNMWRFYFKIKHNLTNYTYFILLTLSI